MKTKITEPVRSALLRRPLKPSVTYDRDVPGFALIVTRTRGFWCQFYQPKGRNPSTGRRWGGGVRHELGDAMTMTVDEARTAAIKAKTLVREGRSPHHEAIANRNATIEERSIVPKSAGEALDAYAKAMMARRQPSEPTRKKSVYYAAKAVRMMQAENFTLPMIDARMISLMLETAPSSDVIRHLAFNKLRRFLAWCRKQGLIERNPCDEIDRDERPKPGRPRDRVPTIDEIRAVWSAAENEPQRELVRFLLLVPLRREEAGGLRWSEIDLQRSRIRIDANRMKKREAHELPLSPAALAILEARRPNTANDLVFPSSIDKPYNGWASLAKRIRKAIGEGAKAQHFTWHDTRRAFVSHLAECGFDVDLLDQCLGHKRAGTLAVYQRASRMAERARALEVWANLVTGVGETENTHVIAFRAR
jgi:integrase